MNARPLSILMLVLLAARSEAQAPTPSIFTLGDAVVDLAVPESPAFSALGVTPDQVARPTSARDLATSLLNGIDRAGNLQTGVAVDAAPFMLLAGSTMSLRQYQEPGEYLTRFLARWQVSFASTKGGGAGDPSARVALGTRVTLFDAGDPRMDATLLGCLVREAARVLDSAPPISPMATSEEREIALAGREALVREGVGPCRDAAARRRWNRTAWTAGLAPTWTSADGTASNLGYSGTALWTSVGYGFEDLPVLEEHAMVAFYLKRRGREIAPDQLVPGAFVTQDTVSAGARLLFGSAHSQFNFETLWVRNTRLDLLEDRYWNVSMGLEQRLTGNIWLSLAVGRQVARAPVASQMSVVSAFNWGLGEK